MVSANDFLRPNNTVKWEALASSFVGGLVFAWWTGLISVVQAVGDAFETFFGGIGTVIQYEVGNYLQTVGSLFNQAWTIETDFGLFQLPASMLIALVAAGIVALGVIYLVE